MRPCADSFFAGVAGGAEIGIVAVVAVILMVAAGKGVAEIVCADIGIGAIGCSTILATFERITSLHTIADIVVAATERLSILATFNCIAGLNAITDIVVVACKRIPRLTVVDPIAAFDTVANVIVGAANIQWGIDAGVAIIVAAVLGAGHIVIAVGGRAGNAFKIDTILHAGAPFSIVAVHGQGALRRWGAATCLIGSLCIRVTEFGFNTGAMIRRNLAAGRYKTTIDRAAEGVATSSVVRDAATTLHRMATVLGTGDGIPAEGVLGLIHTTALVRNTTVFRTGYIVVTDHVLTSSAEAVRAGGGFGAGIVVVAVAVIWLG